jgi:hypothetical protein
MALITKTETLFRIKAIFDRIRQVTDAVRESKWDDAALYANAAQESLEKLIPHIEEVAEAGPPQENAPRFIQPQPDTHLRNYADFEHQDREQRISRANIRKIPISSCKPPEPFSIPKPKPAAVVPPRKPIVTPAPVAPRLPEGPVTFDFSRMPGTAKGSYSDLCYQAAREGQVAPPPLTDAEWESTERFDRLPAEIQARIRAEYAQTGQPVTVRFNEEGAI